jgi:hypothetical protein
MLRLLLLTAMLSAFMEPVQACAPDQPEKFEKFFSRFTKDAAFARKRTRYPLDVMMVERATRAVRPTQIYVQEDEASPALKDFMDANQLRFAGIKRSATAATVHMIRADPLWNLGYRFSLEAGCWYLAEIEDSVE